MRYSCIHMCVGPYNLVNSKRSAKSHVLLVKKNGETVIEQGIPIDYYDF